jgi:hypothetical protein
MCSGEVDPFSGVTRGLDPRVHLLRKKMDCRVKPAMTEDNESSSLGHAPGAAWIM